jgi:hypothetical protein
MPGRQDDELGIGPEGSVDQRASGNAGDGLVLRAVCLVARSSVGASRLTPGRTAGDQPRSAGQAMTAISGALR